jgi:hypothetical protein
MPRRIWGFCDFLSQHRGAGNLLVFEASELPASWWHARRRVERGKNEAVSCEKVKGEKVGVPKFETQ